MKENILEILEKYKSANMKKVKYQLKVACSEQYKKYGGRKGMAERLGMNTNFFSTCINPSQTSIITFENLLKICNTFNFEINRILDQDIVVTKTSRGRKKQWSDENKSDYINIYENEGIEIAREKYNLSKKTAMLYYKHFKS